MPSDVCLVIFFNHRYEKNIPKLYDIYRMRFDNIKIIIPFFKSSDDQRIITVYENSHTFQGFFSQAYSEIQSAGINHYVFVADDCLINPQINQENIVKILHLDQESGFITKIRLLAPSSLSWSHFRDEDLGFKTQGVEYAGEIPSSQEALRIIKSHESFSNFSDQTFFDYLAYNELVAKTSKLILKIFNRIFKTNFRNYYRFVPKVHKRLPFPLLWGYSDFFTVNKDSFNKFVHLCGIFSSMRMFAEIAVPTSLALSCRKLIEINSTEFNAKAFWGVERNANLEQLKGETQGSIQNLFHGERGNLLYIHPIKLSTWEVE